MNVEASFFSLPWALMHFCPVSNHPQAILKGFQTISRKILYTPRPCLLFFKTPSSSIVPTSSSSHLPSLPFLSLSPIHPPLPLFP